LKEDFRKVVEESSLFDYFTLQEGFLFKGDKLCISKSPLRGLIVEEAHGGALANYFDINKTLEILKEHFYCPR